MDHGDRHRPDHVGAFLDALDAAIEIVASPAAEASWVAPSALADLTVGALAAHVLLVARRAAQRLEEPSPGHVGRVVGVGEYYAPARLPAPGALSHPAAARVRADGAHVAARGHGSVVASLVTRRAELAVGLTGADLDRLVAGQDGNAVTFGAFLDTRTTELVVHGDDLAASIGQQTSPSAAALEVTVGVLLAVIRHRAGDAAVARALARPERADADVLRAL